MLCTNAKTTQVHNPECICRVMEATTFALLSVWVEALGKQTSPRDQEAKAVASIDTNRVWFWAWLEGAAEADKTVASERGASTRPVL